MIEQQGTLEISRSRLRHNLELLRGRIGRAKLCVIMKADAYGHGAAQIAGVLRAAGAEWLTVYSLEEARRLMELKEVKGMKLLVLAPLVAEKADPLEDVIELLDGTEVRVNVTDEASAIMLSSAAVDRDEDYRSGVHVHIQVDTGLTRMGVAPEEAERLARMMVKLPGLKLEGLFAHFSHGDVRGHDTVNEQLEKLRVAAERIRQVKPGLITHVQNSGGAWHLGDAGLDMVRVGIAAYGLQPSMEDRIEGLQPIARLVAPMLAIHERPAGTGVGYGHTFVTQRASRLAVVPVGYADGYPRLLSNRCVAQVRGVEAPVVGRVSMDQIIVDVTDVQGVAVGEMVTVISWNPGDANSIDRMAEAIGTIGYEVATHLGERLKRVIVD